MIQFQFPSDDTKFQLWLKQGEYQKAERDGILSLVRNRDVCVDIGAHVGTWARDLSSAFNTVICFEPDRDNFACLEKNLADCPNVTLHKEAVWDKAGNGRLTQGSGGNSGDFFFTEDEDNSGDVPCCRLDEILNPAKYADKIGYIKIDAQGAEKRILQGARALLEANSRVIVSIEQESTYDPRFEASKYLSSIGMRRVTQFDNDIVFDWPPRKE